MISFDKLVYLPGDTITATVTSGTAYSVTAAGPGGSVTGSFQVGSSGITISGGMAGQVWTKVSDNGSTSIFTTVALGTIVIPPVTPPVTPPVSGQTITGAGALNFPWDVNFSSWPNHDGGQVMAGLNDPTFTLNKLTVNRA